MSTDRRRTWKTLLGNMGDIYLACHQLESTQQCFLRLLARPRQPPGDRVEALHGMDRYYRRRKEWDSMTEYCEQALALLPDVEEGRLRFRSREKLLILVADAAEGQGDMRRAHEYDEKATKVWSETGKTYHFLELTACHRRDAVGNQLCGNGCPRASAGRTQGPGGSVGRYGKSG